MSTYKIKATITFDANIDDDVSTIEELAEQMEMSFSAPDGCELSVDTNEFVIMQDE